MKVLTWIIFSLVIVVYYLYLSGTSGYDGAPGTVEPPPPPPTLFDKAHQPPPKLFDRKPPPTLFDKAHQPPPPSLFDRNSRPPPPKLFSRKRDMGGPWRGMMPQKICIEIT